MDKFETLVAEIMADAEADGEPITREEAIEMAKMEMGAKEIKRYEQAEEKKARKPRERKVDETKGQILKLVKTLIEGMLLNEGEPAEVVMNAETDLGFSFKGDCYTLKLTKHRPPKK